MNHTELAACAFDLVTDVAGIMRRAHQQHCDWESSVKMLMTEEEFPKPTGGYEIHIVIHPPKRHRGKLAKDKRRGK